MLAVIREAISGITKHLVRELFKGSHGRHWREELNAVLPADTDTALVVLRPLWR